MASGGLISRLLERLGMRRPRHRANLWRELAGELREEDRKAGRVRNREAEEKLRCGWSYLHAPGAKDEDDAGAPTQRVTPPTRAREENDREESLRSSETPEPPSPDPATLEAPLDPRPVRYPMPEEGLVFLSGDDALGDRRGR